MNFSPFLLLLSSHNRHIHHMDVTNCTKDSFCIFHLRIKAFLKHCVNIFNISLMKMKDPAERRDLVLYHTRVVSLPALFQYTTPEVTPSTPETFYRSICKNFRLLG